MGVDDHTQPQVTTMNRPSASKRAIWTLIGLMIGAAPVPMAVAQDAAVVWGSLDVQSEATSSERIAYFRENLTPHAASAYRDPEYRQSIVRLNSFNRGRSETRIVNLRRTFDIYGLFAGMGTELTPQAQAILDDLGQAITSAGINARRYVVAGHSVVANEVRADQELATQRAQVVRDYLMAKFDIPAERLSPVGFGSHNLKHADTPGKDENNRIEICMIEDVVEDEPVTVVQLPDHGSQTQEQKIEITTRTDPADSAHQETAETDVSTEAVASSTVHTAHTYAPSAVAALPSRNHARAKSQRLVQRVVNRRKAQPTRYSAQRGLLYSAWSAAPRPRSMGWTPRRTRNVYCPPRW